MSDALAPPTPPTGYGDSLLIYARRPRSSYTANGLNQYTLAGGANLSYDANGNLTSDGASAFTYDADPSTRSGRLVSASGAKTATLAYDPLGRLWQVTSPANGTTRFLYDGDELVAEYDAAGTMLRRYMHGAGVDDPHIWYEGATFATPRYPYADHQGSVIAHADAAGNRLNVNSYDEYGVPAATRGDPGVRPSSSAPASAMRIGSGSGALAPAVRPAARISSMERIG